MQYLTLAGALIATLTIGGCATPKPTHVAEAAPSARASAAAVAATDNQNPVICARVETTGSRLAEKECHTASQWAAIRAEGVDDIGNRTRRQLPTDCSKSGC